MINGVIFVLQRQSVIPKVGLNFALTILLYAGDIFCCGNNDKFGGAVHDCAVFHVFRQCFMGLAGFEAELSTASIFASRVRATGDNAKT